MPISFPEKYLLAKIETVEDTDATPDGSNVIRTKNLTATIYDGESVTPAYDGDGGRYRPELRVNEHNTLSCEVDASGSGVAGTPPAYGVLLRACGLSETVVAVTSVAYQVEDANYDALSGYFVRGSNQMVRTTGIRGKVGFRINNHIPEFVFTELKGSYHRPEVAGGPYTLVYGNQADVVPVSSANTTTLTLDGQALELSDFSIASLGQAVARNDYVNSRSTRLSPEPVRGSLTILAPAIGTHNWFTKAESHQALNKLAFSLVHGTVAGNILSIAAAEVQTVNVQETEVDGQLAYSMDLLFLDNPIFTFT